MTLSEWIQSQRIAAILRGEEPETPAPDLECGSGLVVSLQAGRVWGSYPRNDEGPWVAFDVRYVRGPLPPGWEQRTIAPVTPASVVVALLKAAGWPPALSGSLRGKGSRHVPGKG